LLEDWRFDLKRKKEICGRFSLEGFGRGPSAFPSPSLEGFSGSMIYCECGTISTEEGCTVLTRSIHMEGKNTILQQGNSSKVFVDLICTISLGFGWCWGYRRRGLKYP
jgi:hypothetical protein